MTTEPDTTEETGDTQLEDVLAGDANPAELPVWDFGGGGG